MHISKKNYSCSFVALLVVTLPLSSLAATIDGIVSPGEYAVTDTHTLNLVGYDLNGNKFSNTGTLSMMWNGPDQLAVAYVVDPAINNNFYGTSAPLAGSGWSAGQSERSYKALGVSDMSQFLFEDAEGQELLLFQMDYFRTTDPGDPGVVLKGKGRNFDTIGNSFVSFAGGTSGVYQPGSEVFDDTILEWSTSLMWNFREGGGFDFAAYQENSPTPGTDNYVGEMIFEFLIDTSTLDGFGILLAESHHSPSKTGASSYIPDPYEPLPPPANPIPEPTTMALIGVGLAGLGIARRRKRMR